MHKPLRFLPLAVAILCAISARSFAGTIDGDMDPYPQYDIMLGRVVSAAEAAAHQAAQERAEERKAAAAKWTRMDARTIRFEGEIKQGEYERFAQVYDSSVREIVVTSQGGVTDEGIRIGLVIASAGVKVTVVGECLSSCANYLFASAPRREIRHGIVGYHGNVQACFGGARRADTIREFKEKYHMSDEDIRRNLAEEDREMADEARLLKLAGVSQALFDRSCTDDKGMGDGKGYTFLLPKPATFEKYGLHGIQGEQDPAIMKSLTWPYAWY